LADRITLLEQEIAHLRQEVQSALALVSVLSRELARTDLRIDMIVHDNALMDHGNFNTSIDEDPEDNDPEDI
jgi:hypothetical protein